MAMDAKSLAQKWLCAAIAASAAETVTMPLGTPSHPSLISKSQSMGKRCESCSRTFLSSIIDVAKVRLQLRTTTTPTPTATTPTNNMGLFRTMTSIYRYDLPTALAQPKDDVMMCVIAMKVVQHYIVD
jgi:hypothetical protein